MPEGLPSGSSVVSGQRAMVPRRSTRAVRPPLRQYGCYAAAGVVALIGALALMDGVWQVAIGAVVVAGGLVFWGSMRAITCPVCESRVTAMGLDIEGPCVWCMHYLRFHDETLTALDDDHVASHPTFAVPIESAERAMPPCCCGCGKPATHVEQIGPISHYGLVVTARVPHCDHCDSRTTTEIGEEFTLGPANQSGGGTYVALKVRSYRFYREAMTLSGHRKFIEYEQQLTGSGKV